MNLVCICGERFDSVDGFREHVEKGKTIARELVAGGVAVVYVAGGHQLQAVVEATCPDGEACEHEEIYGAPCPAGTCARAKVTA